MAKKSKDILELDPRAWLGNSDLSRATGDERAFFTDLLCIGVALRPRGVFQTDGVAWTDREIAACVRGSEEKNLLLLKGLLDKTVLKRDSKNRAVYCSRMRRDWESKIRKSNAAKKKTSNVLADPVPVAVKKKSSVVRVNPLPPDLEGTRLGEAMTHFIAHRKSIRKAMTPHAVDLLLKKLSRYEESIQIELLEEAIASGWQGVVFDRIKVKVQDPSKGLFDGINEFEERDK